MAPGSAPPRRPVPLWLLPVLWTVALGLWGLSREDSLWRDEAATWQAAQRSPAGLRLLLEHVDVVHGCYYLLMHGLFTCFGAGTTTLRLPSVLAMAMAAACVTTVGHRLGGARTGLAAGMALGLLPAVQFHLQEGRPYALVAAGAGLSTLLLVTALQGPVRTRTWVAYGGTVALTGWLNWLSLLLLAAHLTTLLWVRPGRGTGWRWALASAAATAGVLPLILVSRDQSGQVAWIPPLSWHLLIGPAVLLAIGGACALLERPRGSRLSVAAVGLPLLAVPQTCLIAVSLVKPLFLDRYVLFGMLGLALLIGTAVDAAVRAAVPRFPGAAKWLLPAVVVTAVLALLPESLAMRSPASRVDDVLAVAADVRRMKPDGSAVLFLPSDRRDTAVVTPDAFTGLRDIALVRGPEEYGNFRGVEARAADLRTAMLAERHIVLVTDATGAARAAVTEQDKTKMSVLRSHFTPVADRQVRGRRVTLYERTAPPSP
ncbi:hypothetical protein [Streptomyces sp. NPDC051132]|uniref:glycosyltransferase family 39 protein n=1 Tax=unclassified Streptomyces TaxID=2593676 RepID=UPI00341AEB20